MRRVACQRCGACCHSDDPGYLPLFAVDLERLGARARELTAPGPMGLAMRLEGGHCIALGRASGAGAVRECTIHALRPDCCRWLEPASRYCRAARRGQGLE